MGNLSLKPKLTKKDNIMNFKKLNNGWTHEQMQFSTAAWANQADGERYRTLNFYDPVAQEYKKGVSLGDFLESARSKNDFPGDNRTRNSGQGIEWDNSVITLTPEQALAYASWTTDKKAEFVKDVALAFATPTATQGADGLAQVATMMHEKDGHHHIHVIRHRHCYDAEKQTLSVSSKDYGTSAGYVKEVLSAVLDKYDLSAEIGVDYKGKDLSDSLDPIAKVEKMAEVLSEVEQVRAAKAQEQEAKREAREAQKTETQKKIESIVSLTPDALLLLKAAELLEKEEEKLKARTLEVATQREMMQHAVAAIDQLSKAEQVRDVALKRMEAAEQERDQALTERDAYFESLTKANELNNALSEEVQEQAKAIEEFMRFSEEDDKKINALEDKVTELEAQKESISKQNEMLTFSLDQVSRQVAITVSENSELKQTLSTIEAEKAAEIEALKAHVAELDDINKELAIAVDSRADELEALRKQVEQLQKDFIEASEVLLAERNERAAIENERDTLSGQLERSDSDARFYKKAYETMQKTLASDVTKGADLLEKVAPTVAVASAVDIDAEFESAIAEEKSVKKVDTKRFERPKAEKSAETETPKKTKKSGIKIGEIDEVSALEPNFKDVADTLDKQNTSALRLKAHVEAELESTVGRKESQAFMSRVDERAGEKPTLTRLLAALVVETINSLDEAIKAAAISGIKKGVENDSLAEKIDVDFFGGVSKSDKEKDIKR